MTNALYDEMSPTGVLWLGCVPSHWTLRRLGYFFVERREKVSDKEYTPLSVTKNGIVPQLDTAAKTDDGDNRKRVARGDFVINSRSDRKGSAGIAELDGSVSLINTVLRPQAECHPRFVHYLLRSVAFQEEFYRYGQGIVADLWTTRYSEMRAILLAIPPLPEQTDISAFLDRETGKIDMLVEDQKLLIELLKEKRQAVISRAVTKGLDPTARMKPSGVDWLGDVPEHWEVRRVKTVLNSLEQGWSPQCENHPAQAEEWGVLKVGCVNGGVFKPSENKRLPSNLDPIPALSVRRGDVLVSRANTRELVGGVAFVNEDHPHLMLCDKLYRLRPNPSFCLSEFLALALGSSSARAVIELGASGASNSMLNIAQSTILEMALPLPPCTEQQQIIGHVEAVLGEVDRLSALSEEAVHLLTERRAALISAAVTGKIDVRDRATQEEAA